MAVKKKIEKETGSWVGEIEKYSRQIWLAGLGAYSKISKDGSKLFDNLVKDGEQAEKVAKNGIDDLAEEVDSVASGARSRVSSVKDKALGKWGELEEAFDKRLNKAISRLGVPSRNEVKDLHDKVNTLTRQIEKLTGDSVKTVRTPAKPAAKTAAAKPVTAAAKTVAKAAVKPASKAASTAKAATSKASTAVKPAVKKPVVKKPAAPKAAAKPAASAAPAPAPTASAPASTPAAPAASTTSN